MVQYELTEPISAHINGFLTRYFQVPPLGRCVWALIVVVNPVNLQFGDGFNPSIVQFWG